MNLVQKYIIKEIIPFFLIGNLFFMFLLLMEKMVTLADLFFSKNVPLILLVETIIYLLPSIFFMTIPLAGLLAALIAFSRLSADSELIAMKAIGASNKTLIKPLIAVGIFAAVINLAMGVYFVAKGSTLAYNNLNKIVENISIKDLKANEIYEQIPGILLFVKNKISDTSFDDMIMIQTKEKLIINAAHARITPIDNKSMEMIFYNGTFTMEDTQGKLSTVGFENMSINLPLNINIAKAVNSPMTMSIGQLIANNNNPKALFELHKRFSTPLSAIVMILFGFSLGVFLSRSGKSVGILISIGLAFLYNALILYFENSAGSIPINPALSAWIPLFIFILLLIYSLKRSFK